MGEPIKSGSVLKSFVTYLVTMHQKKTEVRRRYSEFDSFRTFLVNRYSAMLIPLLPPKQMMNNTSEEVIAFRMKGRLWIVEEEYNEIALTSWLNELAQNPYIRKDPIFMAFVSKEDFDVNNEQQLNSMSYHNPEVRVSDDCE